VKLVGRAKDLIITGGLNVYPKEIEELIDAMPGVSESAVVGLPDPDYGEAVTAIVVPKASDSTLDANAIISDLKTRLAGFKIPKSIYFVDELPRNAMGKVQKNVLRERYSRQT
jgi:malonyl-CoA/methylmalonyl-CoA synthetase